MVKVTKNKITMKGSGSGNSVVTVTAPINKGRTKQEIFKIAVNENLFENVVVTHNCKPNFDFHLVLYTSESRFLLDSEGYELLDLENNILLSADLTDVKYSTIEMGDLEFYKSSEFSAWAISVYSIDNILLGSGETDLDGTCVFENLSFVDNLEIKVVAQKESVTKEVTLPINNFEEAYVIYI